MAFPSLAKLADISSLYVVQIDHVTFANAGGAGVVAETLSAAQRILGHDSKLLTVAEVSVRQEPFRHPALTVASAVDNFMLKKSTVPTLTSFFRRRLSLIDMNQLRPDSVTHFHWVEGVIRPSEIAEVAGRAVRSVWTLHDMAPFTSFCHLSIDCRGFENACRNCPQAISMAHKSISVSLKTRAATLSVVSERIQVVTPSNWLKKLAEKSLVFRDFDIRLVRNPIKPMFFKGPNKETARYALGIDSLDVVAVMIATDLADPNKRILEGAEVFLRALDENQAKGKLLLIGGAAEKLKLKDSRLVFLGTRTPEEVADVLPAANFLMSASDVESAGMTIAEAGASGVPSVIIDKGSGVGEMIISDVTGIETKNWEGFEKAISLLVAKPELSRKMGFEASDFAHRSFRPDLISLEYLRLYETGA